MASQPSSFESNVPAASTDASSGVKQRRGQASRARMLKAAYGLMIKLQSEDFTLQEVSRLGKVSIGSIYHQFESKDALCRHVLQTELQKMALVEQAMIERLLADCAGIGDYIPRYVEQFANLLKANNILLGLAMRRSMIDPAMSGAGNAHAVEAARHACNAILQFRDCIKGDAPFKAVTAFRMIFSTVVRQINLNIHDPIACEEEWVQFVKELGWMAEIYLTSERG